MDVKASKYLTIETASSGVCNGILNFASAFALFHGRNQVSTAGLHGLIADSIGETFFVTSLSVLIPSLIARRRRREGTLPKAEERRRPTPAGNLYIRALVTGLVFTCILVPCNAFLLPRIFPEGASLHNVLLWKTLYGVVVGSIATLLAVRRALYEVD